MNASNSRCAVSVSSTACRQKGWLRNSTLLRLEPENCLRLHRVTYPQYWRWSDAIRDTAVLQGRLQAVFGWSVYVGVNANPRSLRNFPLQANGAEMLRLACCMATELRYPCLLSSSRCVAYRGSTFGNRFSCTRIRRR